MGKTNWSRVFVGGLLAGVVINILAGTAFAVYLGKLWISAEEALGHPPQESVGVYIFWGVFYLVKGILAVWLYSAIRPRYGAGAKTAVIAGLAIWIIGTVSFAVALGSFGLFPASVLAIDCFTALVPYIVGTLAGAWVYKEQSQ